MSHPVIQLNSVDFTIDEKEILKEVSLTINRGETFALLGGNGAGKTTLLDMISGNQRPTSGTVKVLDGAAGNNPRVSILSDVVPLFPMLKVKEILHYFAAFQGLSPSPDDRLVEILGLEDIEDKLFRSLSKGQRKRVGLYLALSSKPDILIMDEPTSDLDPMIRERIWKQLLSDTDITVLFTTHDWEEAREYADRLTFIHEGVLLGVPATPAALLAKPNGIGHRKLVVPAAAATPEILGDLPHVCHEDAYHIFAEDRTEELIGRLSKITLNFSVLDSNLQDAYQYLVKTKIA
jgi:ABC-2 type transport system ATP-binding protein